MKCFSPARRAVVDPPAWHPRPVRRVGQFPGLAMVAEQQMNCGLAAVERGRSAAGAGSRWPRGCRRRPGSGAPRPPPRSAGSRTA